MKEGMATTHPPHHSSPSSSSTTTTTTTTTATGGTDHTHNQSRADSGWTSIPSSAAMRRLKLHITPGHSLGSIVLNSHITEVIHQLERDIHRFPKANFIYSLENPFSIDMRIELHYKSIRLHFDPNTQLLTKIEIVNFSHLDLTFGKVMVQELTSSKLKLTAFRVYNVCGATTPGTYDDSSHEYFWKYDGLTFVFPIQPQHRSQFLKPNFTQLPIEFDDNTTPECSRIIIFPIESEDIPQQLSSYFEDVILNPMEGIFFDHKKISINFGDYCQQVLSLMGPPNNVYMIQKSKLNSTIVPNDYYFNYYDYGMDILFDGFTHCVNRIVIHTNFPHHWNFGKYRKCNFKILKKEELPDNDADDNVINSKTKWDEIKKEFGENDKPVVSNGPDGRSPFGPSYVFGYPGIIFEITETGYVACIVLYKP